MNAIPRYSASLRIFLSMYKWSWKCGSVGKRFGTPPCYIASASFQDQSSSSQCRFITLHFAINSSAVDQQSNIGISNQLAERRRQRALAQKLAHVVTPRSWAVMIKRVLCALTEADQLCVADCAHTLTKVLYARSRAFDRSQVSLFGRLKLTLNYLA